MHKIKILDCTLRDGGYCNEWHFGKKNISKILSALVESKIDIIECGYLTQKNPDSENSTRFASIQEIETYLPHDHGCSEFVAMINYGEYPIEKIPERKENSIDGIRVAFHKNDVEAALQFSAKIKERGYKVFLQPMVTLCYSDSEFLQLIEAANKIEPYAFYIVDSFGVMKRRDLMRLFYLVIHNLDKKIIAGFHAHNNLQLAYSNAQLLVEKAFATGGLIVDSCVMGMGRGAGNLNTELFAAFLNDELYGNNGEGYKVKPLLSIIDEVLAKSYAENPWGYSLPNYLSASFNAHPNYASFLSDKNTLTVENMEEIFSLVSLEKKNEFDKEYIENLYHTYMAKDSLNQSRFGELKEKIAGKTVMLIAPGKSSLDEKERIFEVAKNPDVVAISVNHEYEFLKTDYIFASNLRRFKSLPKNILEKAILTSNIPCLDSFVQVDYKSFTNQNKIVHDNASLMLIKLLINLNAKKILLAGLDGYSHDIHSNYANKDMEIATKEFQYDLMNRGMNEVLCEFAKKIEIEFVTTPRYVGYENTTHIDGGGALNTNILTPRFSRAFNARKAA